MENYLRKTNAEGTQSTGVETKDYGLSAERPAVCLPGLDYEHVELHDKINRAFDVLFEEMTKNDTANKTNQTDSNLFQGFNLGTGRAEDD